MLVLSVCLSRSGQVRSCVFSEGISAQGLTDSCINAPCQCWSVVKLDMDARDLDLSRRRQHRWQLAFYCMHEHAISRRDPRRLAELSTASECFCCTCDVCQVSRVSCFPVRSVEKCVLAPDAYQGCRAVNGENKEEQGNN